MKNRTGAKCGCPPMCDRRDFLAFMMASGVCCGLSQSAFAVRDNSSVKKRNIKLGFDNFSIRAFGWKAPQLIKYAASLKVDTLLLSDLGVFETFDRDYLKKIKTQAEECGLELQVGTGSICPSSGTYNEKKWGKAEDHLRLLIRTAKSLGVSAARCYQGHAGDRKGDGGIYRHIEKTVKVCKAVQNEAEDAEVKIAIENHAGDMQAWELAGLIEAAGTGYVGATMDPGNAAWTMEDPLVNLEILGPYAVTTGIRDTSLWETERGAGAMWTNMGEGVVDWNLYVDRFEKLCPNVPFVLEIISYKWGKEIPYLEPELWKLFPKARAREFSCFLALAKKGEKYTIPEKRPRGKRSKILERSQQKFDLEQSIAFCKKELGLGRN